MAPKNRAFDPNRKEMPELIMASFEGHTGGVKLQNATLRGDPRPFEEMTESDIVLPEFMIAHVGFEAARVVKVSE